MKLGVMAAGLGGMEWEKALDYCQQVGLEAIELPVGAYPGKPFFDPAAVLKDAKAPAEDQGRLRQAQPGHYRPGHARKPGQSRSRNGRPARKRP